MKIKLISISLLVFLFSCGSASQHSGDHNHTETEAVHDHEAEEGHDHQAEGHSHEGEEHNHEAEEAAEPHAHKGAITFNNEQAKKLDFQITKAGRLPFKSVVKTSGTIDGAQGDESMVVATASGTVVFDKVLTEGAAVGKGQSLVVVQSENMTDDNLVQRIAAARAAKNLADQDLRRAEELAGDAVSEKEIAALRLAAEQAAIQLETLTKNVSTKGKSIVSPAAGFVKNVLVREGQYVSVGDPILSVSKNNRVQLRAEVPLKDYEKLRGGELTARIVLPYGNKSIDLSELGGKLVSVGKAASGSFYVPVTFEFLSRGDIIPGGYVEVFLMSGKGDEQLVVPYSALVEEQGVYSVYVKVCEDSYEKRYVKIGDHNGDQVVILDGVAPGEEIVSRGAYFVKLAAASSSAPAHAHNH